MYVFIKMVLIIILYDFWYSEYKSQDITIDTKAIAKSIVGINQFLAFKNTSITQINFNMILIESIIILFDIRSVIFIGFIKINLLIRKIKFFVIKIDISL